MYSKTQLYELPARRFPLLALRVVAPFLSIDDSFIPVIETFGKQDIVAMVPLSLVLAVVLN